MERAQLDNIIGFTFNFHTQCDTNWYEQDPGYIMEKWQKYIGTEPISNLFDLESLPGKLQTKTKNWLYTWNVSDSKLEEMKEIIYLLNMINTRVIIYRVDLGYPYWVLEDLVELFSKVINLEKVNKELYNHQHALIKREIVTWLNKTENKRAYNLNLLI